MRAFLLALAWGLLALSVAGLTFAVAASPHWGVGLLAGLLLVVVVAGLAFLARHQRAAIHDIKRDLARSRVVAEALIDASPDGIVLLEGTRIVSANPAARQLFGVSAAAGLAGRDLSTLIEPRDRQRLLAWVQHREAGGLEPDCLEFAGRRTSGAPLPLEASAARIPLTQGAHLALFLRDLTDRQRVSQRSKIVDRLEGLGAAAVSLADEFEKVLGGMRDAAERARSGSGPEETGEALELIERETLRGIALARRARAIVPETVEPGERQPVDVRSLLREIGGELTGRLGGAVRFEDRSPASDEPLLVSAAPGPLRQALMQVMENAAEAQGDGTVLLRVHALDQDEVAASRRPGSEAGRFGVVAIKDQGEGMTDDVRTRAFAPFFSTKGTRASGLGLTLAAGIVRAHGGFIELDSEPGEGTVARLAFPLAEPAGGDAGEETGPLADERGVRGTETLLAVDDDGSALDGYRRLLQPLGYHVEAASAAEIALHRLRQRPEIDLVLLDMVLPGSTGPELVRRMLKTRPGQRVLAVSPYPLPDKEEQVLELGAVGIFRKPLDPDKLPEAIRRALDRPRPAQPD
jgi:PAS domain S-box-containing protein